MSNWHTLKSLDQIKSSPQTVKETKDGDLRNINSEGIFLLSGTILGEVGKKTPPCTMGATTTHQIRVCHWLRSGFYPYQKIVVRKVLSSQKESARRTVVLSHHLFPLSVPLELCSSAIQEEKPQHSYGIPKTPNCAPRAMSSCSTLVQ